MENAVASQFIELYDDELKAGEVTKDAIYEWWTQTKDRFQFRVSYDQMEQIILDHQEMVKDLDYSNPYQNQEYPPIDESTMSEDELQGLRDAQH